MSHDDETGLIQEHWQIATNAVNSLRSSGVDRDELVSDAQLAMLQALRAYDPSRGASIGTFLYRQVRWRMLDMLRSRRLTNRLGKPRWKLPQQLLDESQLLDTRTAPESFECREYFDWLTQSLPPRHRDVVVGYFRDGRTLEDIGAEIGRSKCRCSQIVKESLASLRHRLEGRATE